MGISSDVAQHPDVDLDRSRPTKISHVVLNSGDTDQRDVVLSSTCSASSTPIAPAYDGISCAAAPTTTASRFSAPTGPSLNHVAYEVPNIDGLMRGTGRVKQNGFDIEWGVGRHGPGNNVFSYFIEPDGFVAEYTTELDQIDEATHVPQDAAYWDKIMPPRGDRWGTAGHPSNRMNFAMSGGFYLGDEPPEGVRCEDIIGRKFG